LDNIFKMLSPALLLSIIIAVSLATCDAQVLPDAETTEDLWGRDTSNVTLAAPIVAVPSEHWYVAVLHWELWSYLSHAQGRK
jgi:hypothetical protein